MTRSTAHSGVIALTLAAALLLAGWIGTADAAPQHRFPLDNPFSTGFEGAPAFGGRVFQRPVFLTHAPEFPEKLFIVEQGSETPQNGLAGLPSRVIYLDRDADAKAEPKVLLDLSGQINAKDLEEGLLGLAFDPQTPGVFYVSYTALNPRRVELSEYRYAKTADGPVLVPNSRRVILTQQKKHANHNGSMLAFGPDGFLYYSIGDGGYFNDPDSNGQNRKTLLAKILRIDPRKTSPDPWNPSVTRPYAVPSDNPFVEEAKTKQARDEIYAYGVRNPWRFSFDRGAKRELWLADVGQDRAEEIDLVVKGGNYGWRIFEGDGRTSCSSCSGGLLDKPVPGVKYIEPILSYDHDVGKSITGGYVYRGKDLPELAGAYLYGDFVKNQVWALRYDIAQGKIVSNLEVLYVPSPVSFGEDAQGEVYVISALGNIQRFARAQPPQPGNPPFPTKLSQTGLFAKVKELEPEPYLEPFEVNSPLWSDGADKGRWMALPDGGKIGFKSEGAWNFPLGTAFVKHFERDGKRLETRVLLRHRQGWAGYTYKWNGTQDATLVGKEAIRENGWYYPSRNDCMTCHNAGAGFVLGPTTHQLNRRANQASESVLERWIDKNLFVEVPGQPIEPKLYPAHADPSDASATLNRRARSYLASNCAVCHFPNGPTSANMDLRFLTLLSQTQLLDVPAGERFRVRPGKKEQSALFHRVRSEGDDRMPPLASSRRDPLAVELLGDWIDHGLAENP